MGVLIIQRRADCGACDYCQEDVAIGEVVICQAPVFAHLECWVYAAADAGRFTEEWGARYVTAIIDRFFAGSGPAQYRLQFPDAPSINTP